ncbi:uncharacterized protein LOC115191671 isoform X2 [Salmo trutta]|uniref:uncharacterized protein LOC115191671 isoform X2 n=1 Tax=Salmo trutta TaxID=8032 RepID=UPI00113154F8|nr:uncharacterized protein LOC115191671 isoform X2 [Salmo trutta]
MDNEKEIGTGMDNEKEIGTGMDNEETVQALNPCRSSDRIQMAGLRKTTVEEQQDEEEASGADTEDDPTGHDDYTPLLPMSSQRPSQPVKPKTTSSLVKLTEDEVHHSIVPVNSLLSLTRCTTCCKLFHCPLCLSFKPTKRSRLQRHVDVHLKNAVSFKVIPPSLGNFPIVGQILNKQEANYHWLEDGAVFEGLASPETETERREPSQPAGQITDTVPWPVWLIKQEEMADDDLESEGYGEWIPETHKANQNIRGESDEDERSPASGGSKELGLDDFKREQSPLLVSAEDTATPMKTKYETRMLKRTGKPRFRCDICGEKFQRQSGLTRHQRHKHNTVKTYSCTVCGKGFTYIKSLNTHELMHSDLSIRSTITLDEAKARKRGLTDEPTDRNAAGDMISAILHSKPGGEKVFREYRNTKGLTDSTRRLMVNIIVADMMENHGIPPSSVRTNYALGIVTLFPYLNDPDSEHGYEQYYDAASGSGYLTWRIKTVGRNKSCKIKRRTKSTYQNGPKAQPSSPSAVEELLGDECKDTAKFLLHDEQVSMSEVSICSVGSDSSGSALTLEKTKARKRRLTDEPTDRNAARDMISAILHSKPGGEKVFREYRKTKGLTDSTRRLMVNIIVADMMESHGRIPPSSVRTNYALGIVTLFPYLNDPDSEHGYEKYYDAASGSGYLTWRIKTVGRNTSCKTKKRTKPTYQNGPMAQRSCPSAVEQLSGDECREAISVLQHTTTNESLVREKMMATFQYRQEVVHDPEKSSTVLDVFPRFLDTTGLINQDFTRLFGEVVSGTFMAKWPTFFKPRVIADCKTLPFSEPVEDLLSSAQQESNDYGWESDLAAILLLLHLLPPTSKGPKTAKIRTSQAADHLVRFMKVGTSMVTFLETVRYEQQPFLLCVGERKNSIQKFYIVVDQKTIPCKAKTSVAAFDELFKAHYVFSVSYHEALCNFYTFIQTTVYGIDVGKAKESSRVKEIRVRLLNKDQGSGAAAAQGSGAPTLFSI